MFIVAVKEFTWPVVFAASLTAASGLIDGADDPPPPEPAAQPATAATIVASPAAYSGRRVVLAFIKTSKARP
jgi:hypothetical protein